MAQHANKQPQKIYTLPKELSLAVMEMQLEYLVPCKVYIPPKELLLAIMEVQLEYLVPCPNCDKRTIDFSETSDNMVLVRLKCPHCRKIVSTPLTTAHMANIPSA